MRVLLIVSAVVALAHPAWAAGCACSQSTASCAASASVDAAHQQLTFQINTDKCVEISYALDGASSSLTVRGGSGSIPYLDANSDAPPAVSVQACSICAGANEVDASAAGDVVSGPRQACETNCVTVFGRQMSACLTGQEDSAACTSAAIGASVACYQTCPN